MSNVSLATNWLTDCSNDDNEDYRCAAITTGKTISAVLSLIGCLFALLVIVVYKKFRFMTQRIVMFMLVPCMCLAILSLWNSAGESSACVAKGFFRNYAGLSQNLWIICIEVHLLVMLLKSEKYRHLEKVYHAAVWGGALFFSLIPLFGTHYGHAGIWCWIKGTNTYENALRVICYYFWLMLLVFGGGVIYIYIIYNVYSRVHSYDGTYNPESEHMKTQYKKSIRPLLLYPIVDLLMASVSTTNRIQNWANPSNPIFGLYLAHAIVSPLWGFVNALLYLVNADTVAQLHPVTFWNEIQHWGKTTFTFTKSVDTGGKNMEYTLKDERSRVPDVTDVGQSVGDMI